MTSPSQALQTDSKPARFIAFHPNVPTKYECVLALIVLSVYEYAQRGNLKKQRSRVGQALMLALDLRLYAEEKQGEEFVEARRRAWWMTVSFQSWYTSFTKISSTFAFVKVLLSAVP